MSTEWRVHAQRILTGEWLTRDLPLSRPTTTRELSGPGGVSGVLEPEMLHLTANDGRPMIEEWSTALYVEEAGQIRGGGVVNKVGRQKATKSIEAVGFCGYCSGVPYMGEYRPADGFPDPIDVFRHLIAYPQTYPDGDIDLSVTGTAESWLRLSSGSGPFIMTPFENRDCGDTMNQIAQATPFDYLERLTWANAARDTVRREVQVGFPRIGRRRHDLRFADGENIVDFDAIVADGSRYANDVYGMGLGEGRGMLRSRASVRDGRLRRPAVVSRKAATQGLLDRETQRELRTRQLLLDISEVTVADHINARIAAISPGDDVLVDLDVEWEGRVRMWLRVLAVQEAGDAPGIAVLKTQRSELFDYRSPASPTGEPQVMTL